MSPLLRSLPGILLRGLPLLRTLLLLSEHLFQDTAYQSLPSFHKEGEGSYALSTVSPSSLELPGGEGLCLNLRNPTAHSK